MHFGGWNVECFRWVGYGSEDNGKPLDSPMGMLRRKLNASISRRERKSLEINSLIRSC